jgi:hypothetical protein
LLTEAYLAVAQDFDWDRSSVALVELSVIPAEGLARQARMRLL